MNNGYLHCSVIFKAGNLNYNESIGNIMSLKKLTTEGKTFSYISRQAIRYDIVRILEEECSYSKAGINRDKGVVQFSKDSTIDQYPEIDFFGYMKTEKKSKQKTEKSEQKLDELDQEETKTKIRKAVVRLTDAISLEPFYNEMDFSTNMGLASRAGLDNDIYQSEIHKSFYTYSITIDLDKVGIDKNYNIEIDKKDKIERLNSLLYAIKILYRDIRGKRENLSPLFIIGGIYPSGNPFFYNQIKLSFSDQKILLNTQIINSILKTKMFDNTPIKNYTLVGSVNGYFSNINEIDVVQDKNTTIENFFELLTENIENYYKD